MIIIHEYIIFYVQNVHRQKEQMYRHRNVQMYNVTFLLKFMQFNYSGQRRVILWEIVQMYSHQITNLKR